MKTYQTTILALVASAIVLFYVFGNQYFRINLSQNEQMIKVLAQLKDQDVRLNEHMLLVGNGMLANFDSMVQISKKLNTLQDRLLKNLNSMPAEDSEELKVIAKQLFVELQQKLAWVEQYKEEHAILNNSQVFVPSEIEHIAPLLWVETQAKLYDLSADVAVYAAKPSKRMLKHIEMMIGLIKEDKKQSGSDHVFSNIFTHIQVIVDKSQLLQRISRDVLRQPTMQLIDKIELLQQKQHAEAVQKNDDVMVIMSALALLGLLIIIVIVHRLRRVVADMKGTVSELEYLKFALDQHSIVGMTDSSGRIIYANDRFCDISQFSREELIGQDHRILNSGSHPKIFFFNMWKTISKGETWHGEIQNKRKDGSLYWVETSIVPFLGAEGKVERYIALRTDITSRKEEEVRSVSLARFPAENPYPVMRLDHNGTVIYANDASYIILDALHLSIGDRLPADMQQDCKTVFADNSTLMAELTVGDETLELTYSSLPGTMDINLYARNISDVKRSLEAIAGSEQRIRQVMDTALDGMIMVDGNGHVTYWNPQAEKIFGWSSAEMIGEASLDKLFPAEQMLKVQQQFSSMMNQRTEIIGLHQSGETVHIEISVLMIKTKGVFDYFSIIVHDISERILSEKRLEEARDMAVESSKMKSMFLSTVSHEIRTPMNGVIGMTDLLLDTELDAEQREFAKTIHASSDALLMIINDILDFSKIEAGHMDIDCTAFSLPSMIEASVGVVALKAHEKGLMLNVFIDPEIPEVLVGDAGRLRQIMLNIIDNAVKFTAQGDVNVHIQCIEKSDAQVTMAFSIRDTGIGLSKEAQGRLFQPFVQADGSTTRQYGGTGLGLAICKKLVELMGGKIELFSELGKGSMFSFELTMPISDDEGLQTAVYDATLLSGLHVFIVDGDANSCFILSQYLRFWNMQVISMQDSASALARLHADSDVADVIIIAQALSDGSGLDMAQEVRKHPELADIPMILHAGYDHSSLKDKARDAGFSAVLPKPINMSYLFDCLAQALRIDVMQAPGDAQHNAQQSDMNDANDATLFHDVHVLLVEDNPVNQRVAQMHLAKLGCTVNTVNDGQQAMHAMMQDDAYDLVFMDCQMPVMDGFAATKNIRAYETEKGGHRCIVAMTANAMKGDRERCLQTGMDDYISKPVSRAKIAEVIQRNLAAADEALERSLDQSNEPPIDHPLRHSSDDRESHVYTINLDQLRDLFGDDNEAIAEILQLFQVSMRQVLMEKMPHAFEHQDAQQMKALSHELKGAAANIGGDDIAKRCAEMEEQAEAGLWDGVAMNMAELREAYSQMDKMCAELGVE